jgi:hypothetical protein
MVVVIVGVTVDVGGGSVGVTVGVTVFVGVWVGKTGAHPQEVVK